MVLSNWKKMFSYNEFFAKRLKLKIEFSTELLMNIKNEYKMLCWRSKLVTFVYSILVAIPMTRKIIFFTQVVNILTLNSYFSVFI